MISDHEMRYYQFKARQVFLLQKENDEWEKYYEQTIKSEKTDNDVLKGKILRDVGIQAKPKTPLISAVSDHKRDIIQKSLKNSLQRLKDMHPSKPKDSSTANFKIRNKGFFLPHDLKQQRVIARRSYLASLPKEPQVSKQFCSEKNDLLKIQVETNINPARKPVPQPWKKQQKLGKFTTDFSGKSQNKSLPSKQSKYEDSVEIQDKNIDDATDAIIDDLLGETVTSLFKIENRKENPIDKTLNYFSGIVNNIQEQRTKLREKWNLSDSKTKDHQPIPKTFTKLQDWIVREKTDPTTASVHGSDIYNLEKNLQDLHLPKTENNRHHISQRGVLEPEISTDCILQNPLEFHSVMKDISAYKNISLDKKEVENIFHYKKQFYLYLKKISHIEKESFNPWKIANRVAEAILDDCFHDIAQELNDVPSTIVTKLYDQEFIQS